MALPIDQTVTLIVTEALNLSGITNPTAADITRAGDKWLRPALETIAKRIDLPLFEETKIATLKPYEVLYTLPNDLDRIIEVAIYIGEHFNNLQSATANTVTFAATEDISEEEAKGKLLFITSGASQNSMVRVIGYDEVTKIADISPSFATIPSSDGYLLADKETFLDLRPESDIGSVIKKGTPSKFHIFGKTPKKEIYFDKAIKDTQKGMIKIRYTLYPHRMELTDPKMTWIYNELMGELIQGVLAYSFINIDDTRRIAELQIFEKIDILIIIKKYLEKKY